MKTMASTLCRLTLTATLALGALTLSSAPAAASEGWSWNLSRDMMIDFASGTPVNNSLGAWTFMQSSGTSYVPLGLGGGVGACWSVPYLQIGCWYDSPSTPAFSAIVGLSPNTSTSSACPAVPRAQGVPILHPGVVSDAVVRWTNPLPQPLKVQILGRFTHTDGCTLWSLADGVTWSVLHNTNLRASGTLQSVNPGALNETGVYTDALVVNPNDDIFFIVQRNGNYYFDSTELDVLIVAQ